MSTEKNLLSSYINTYINFENVSGVVTPTKRTAVTTVSASAASYTFEMNKNYKWIPSSGSKTINATSYSGYNHGVSELYVDLSSGATLTFANDITVKGDIIDGSVNRIKLEWWGSSVTATINVNSEDSSSVVEMSYVATGCSTSEINGVYTDTGSTYNGQPIYTNGNNYYLLYGGYYWEIWYNTMENHGEPNWYNSSTPGIITGYYYALDGTGPTIAENSSSSNSNDNVFNPIGLSGNDNYELTVLAKKFFNYSADTAVCFEACGNYFDSGYTKNSKKIYTNGAFSLYYTGDSWRIVHGIANANNFEFSNLGIDSIDIKSGSSPSGTYTRGSEVTIYDHSYAPVVSGRHLEFSFVKDSPILNGNYLFLKWENQVLPSTQLTTPDNVNFNGFIITKEPWSMELVQYTSGGTIPPGLTYNSDEYQVSLYGTPTTLGTYTLYVSGLFKSSTSYSYYQTALEQAVLTATFNIIDVPAPDDVWVIGTRTSDENAGYDLGGHYVKQNDMVNGHAVYYNSAKSQYLYVAMSEDGPYYAWIFWGNLNKATLEEAYLFSEDLYNTVRTNTTLAQQPASPVGLNYMNESDWWNGLSQSEFCVTDVAQADPSELTYTVTGNSSVNGTYVFNAYSGYGGAPTYYCSTKNMYMFKVDCDGSRRYWALRSSVWTDFYDHTPSTDEGFISYTGNDTDTPSIGNWSNNVVVSQN